MPTVWLDIYATWVSFIADNAGLLALLATAALFVKLACGVFPRGLQRVFGETGLPQTAILRAIMLCGRNRASQRLFFEFALVKSRGEKLSSREWRQIVDDFAIFLGQTEGGAAPVLEVRNCTHLAETAFSRAVERYFRFLSTGRAKGFYSIGRFDDCWHAPVRVSEAYIMPSVLLSGLLSEFDSDWEHFIDQYRRTLSRSDGNDLTTEPFSIFSWLLWGPSREVDWKDRWDGLCQMAYGDENNSLPLFVSRGGSGFEVLRGTFAEADGKGGFGGLFTVDIRLVPKAEFLRHERLGMNGRNAYFIDKMMADNRLSFIPRVEDAKAAGAALAGVYYCTAYLWLLFERDEPDGHFHPESSVVFFVHANLADAAVCRFLRDRLMEQVLAHFREVSGGQATSERKYRFVCGVNASLERFCLERIKEASGGNSDFATWLRNHVALEGRHNPLEAFAALDDFCRRIEPVLEFRDVDPDDRSACADLAVFYAGIYSDAFPNEDERESLPNFLRYLKNSRNDRNWAFRVLLAKDEKGMLGGIVFDYFHDINSMVVEFVCVDPERRRSRIGSRLWWEAIHVADALAAKHGRKGVDFVFCEVDSPSLSSDRTQGHLSFWRNHGFGRLDFDYVQPALSEGLRPVEGLWWIGFARSPGAGASAAVDARLLEKVLHHYLHFAMDIPFPDANAQFLAMKRQLTSRDVVKLIPLEF